MICYASGSFLRIYHFLAMAQGSDMVAHDGLEQLFEERIPRIIPAERVEEFYPALAEAVEHTRERIQRLQEHGMEVIPVEQVDSTLKNWKKGDPKISAYGRFFRYMKNNGVVPARIYKFAYFRKDSPRAQVFQRWSHIERKGLWPGAKVVFKGIPDEIFTVAKIELDCKLFLEELPGDSVDSRECMPVR